MIRSFLGALEPERRRNLALESEIGADILPQVAQIVPDLWQGISTLRQPATANLDPNEARFRIFDAVTSFLKTGARPHPMLIVIDDLHDADEASLALLRFMARELKGAPIVLVGTYRDLEVRRSPALSKMIGELGREACSIPVSGLSESEVGKFVEFKAGRAPDQLLVAKLCAATNGNPLFVDGIVRNLIAEAAFESAGTSERPFKIPGGVREAIRGRLDDLSKESNALLAAAAAIGNEFEFNLLQSAVNVSSDDAHRLLDEASRAGIVTALGHGRFRFSHALIREAVYEGLDTNSRVLIHGKIANRLEEIYREDIDPHLAELARHFREAGVTGKAIDYSGRAGWAAAAVFAFDDATMHAKAVLEMMEEQGAGAQQRAYVLGLLGDLAFSVDRGNSVKYRDSAIALYESVGSFDKAAVIRVRQGRSLAISGDPVVNGALAIEHFRRAEPVLAKGPETIELAWLYEGITAYESQRLDLVRCASAARRAMEISERIGDKLVWSPAAGFLGFVLGIGGQLKEAFALFDRAFEAADEANTPGSGHAVANLAGWCCQWLGDPRAARAWFERELDRPRNARLPHARRELSAAVAFTYFLEGQIGEVLRKLGPEDPAVRFWVGGEWEAIADLCETQAEASQLADDRVFHLYQSLVIGQISIILGDYARAETNLQYGLDNQDRGPLLIHEMRARPYLALCYVAMNRLDAAEEQMARCRQIMASGEDWRGRVGDIARSEGVIAAARGNYAFAYRQFEAALALHQKYHLAWEEADTLQFWGRALAAAGDRTRAAEKFDAAMEVHRARGVGPRFLEWLTADKMRALGPHPTRTDDGSATSSHQPESRPIGSFRREGDFWTISYLAGTFRLKDAKGLRYIAYLLARPGNRIHVYDLIEAVEGSAAGGRTTIHTESEDLEIVREIDAPAPTIDGRARSEYRARLRDLQADLDDSERMNDLGRSDLLRSEIEMVGEELTGSSGLGRRARATSGSAERARGLVGKNIRSMVEKIRLQHPALGRHFAGAISTGNFCAYQPDPDHPISWRL